MPVLNFIFAVPTKYMSSAQGIKSKHLNQVFRQPNQTSKKVKHLERMIQCPTYWAITCPDF